jgi:F1F0 ATPase subunit 2
MNIVIAGGGGILLGIFFYGGLWMTVRALASSAHPVVLTLSSFWGRTAVALAGFLLASRAGWMGVVACLTGFAAGRLIVSIGLRSKRCI